MATPRATLYVDVEPYCVFETVGMMSSAWREALLFVALARIGEIFALIAELRFWVSAAPGMLPAPFDRLPVSPLRQLGKTVWPLCEACDGDGFVWDDPRDPMDCTWCDGRGSGAPTRIDDTIAVLDDWRQERGLSWAAVLPRLTLFGKWLELYVRRSGITDPAAPGPGWNGTGR